MCHLHDIFGRGPKQREYERAVAQARADIAREVNRDRVLAEAAETAKRAWEREPVREPATAADRALTALLATTGAAMLTPYAVFALQVMGA